MKKKAVFLSGGFGESGTSCCRGSTLHSGRASPWRSHSWTARLDPPSLIDNQLRLAGLCMEYFSSFLSDSRNLSATKGDLSECVLAWNSLCLLSPSGLCSWRERESLSLSFHFASSLQGCHCCSQSFPDSAGAALSHSPLIAAANKMSSSPTSF